PKPRDYSKNMPKKMRRGAIRSALSTLVRDDQLVVVDKLEMDTPKTKEMRQVLNALVGDQSALVLVTDGQKAVRKSVSNLANAHSIVVNYLNIRDLLKYDKVIMPLDTLEVIKSIWGKEG
ncbi:MAG: 50S ribosomal protein L4, partial [Phototrophicales bacterium]